MNAQDEIFLNLTRVDIILEAKYGSSYSVGIRLFPLD